MKRRPAAALALLLACPAAFAAEAVDRGAPVEAPWALQPQAAMTIARAAHQATPLPDGRVLISGGCGGTGCSPAHASAEIFDPHTAGFSAAATMAAQRVGHAAAALPGGNVLVAGGWNGSAALATAEVFDAATARFSSVGALAQPRMNMPATVLADGRIFVSGGETRTGTSTATTDIYDPASARFSAGGALREARAFHTATRLSDGRVLIVGGQRERGAILSSAEIYDPSSGRSDPVGALSVPRYKHAATLLADGRVLVVGGSGPGPEETARHASSEFFDPATRRFSAGPALRAARYKMPDAIALIPGGVVIAGGATYTERWSTDAAAFTAIDGDLGARLEFNTLTPLADGSLLLAGGYDTDIRATAQTWRLQQARPPRRHPLNPATPDGGAR